jgi:hypothetical protein
MVFDESYCGVGNGFRVLIGDEALDARVHRLHVPQHRLLVVQPFLSGKKVGGQCCSHYFPRFRPFFGDFDQFLAIFTIFVDFDQFSAKQMAIVLKVNNELQLNLSEQ